jgi:transposase-like protein
MTQTLNDTKTGLSLTAESGILLQCPSCMSGLGFCLSNAYDAHKYDCSQCYYTMQRENGIWHA